MWELGGGRKGRRKKIKTALGMAGRAAEIQKNLKKKISMGYCLFWL